MVDEVGIFEIRVDALAVMPISRSREIGGIFQQASDEVSKSSLTVNRDLCHQ
jgi:hypothetical protein